MPLRGTLPVLLGASMLYVLVALGIGLLISSCRQEPVRRQPARAAGHLHARDDAVRLSVRPAQHAGRRSALITYVLPARYYVTLLQTIFLAGNVWSVIVPNMLVLAAMVALLGLGSRAVTQKAAGLRRAMLDASAADPRTDAQGAAGRSQGPAQPHEPARSADRAGR